MKLPVIVASAVFAVLLSSCAEQTPVATVSTVPTESASAPAPSQEPTVSLADMPDIDESDVTLECGEFGDGAVAFVRQEANVMANDVQYRVATVACGMLASEVSAEVVESFVIESGAWVSTGLVSGSDVPFNTMGPCESDNVVVKCPAFVLGEEGEAVGYIEITGQDNGLVWNFVAEEEVAL